MVRFRLKNIPKSWRKTHLHHHAVISLMMFMVMFKYFDKFVIIAACEIWEIFSSKIQFLLLHNLQSFFFKNKQDGNYVPNKNSYFFRFLFHTQNSSNVICAQKWNFLIFYTTTICIWKWVTSLIDFIMQKLFYC